MNTSLLKVISILSSLIGVVCGFVALLPFIGGIAFFIMMCLSSVIVIFMLMNAKVLQFDSVPECLTIGGISGFISYIAFSIVYIPLTIIMIRGFKYAANYGIALILGHSNLFVIIVLSLFMAIIAASINAFTAFIIYYITETLKNMNNK